MPRTVSSGCGGTVRPPITTPREATSCVSMGLVSMATTRLQAGHLNAAASVPSPGSWRSSKTIWVSQSTQRNFITWNAERGTRNRSCRAPDALSEVVPDVGAGMEGHPRQQGDGEFLSQALARVARKLGTHHVLHDAEQGRPAVSGGAHRATHRVTGFRCWDGHGEDRRRRGEEVAQLVEALHAGRQVEQ